MTAFHGLDPDAQRKEIGEVRKRWATKQKGVGAILTEIVTRNPFAGRVDPEAERAVPQLDAMQGELAERPFALAHMNVHVWDETRDGRRPAGGAGRGAPERAGARGPAGDAEQHLRAARRHAGQRVRGGDEPRRLRVELRGHPRCSPVTGVSQGTRTDWRFGGPALLMGTTRRGVPLSFALNAPGLGPRAPAHRRLDRVGQEHAPVPDGRAVPALPGRQGRRVRPRPLVHGRCLALGGDWIELGRRRRRACSRCARSTGRRR